MLWYCSRLLADDHVILAPSPGRSPERREVVLLVEWLRSLNVVIVVTPCGRRRHWVTVVRTRPVPSGRLTSGETLMRCGVCDNGERHPGRHPYVEERDHRVAVVDPCLSRSSTPSGARMVRLGVPLLDDYLDFVAARSRPNTVLATAYDLKCSSRWSASRRPRSAAPTCWRS